MPDLLAADFSFIARRAYSPEDAQDLTQDFFVRILKGDWLHRVKTDNGIHQTRVEAFSMR